MTRHHNTITTGVVSNPSRAITNKVNLANVRARIWHIITRFTPRFHKMRIRFFVLGVKPFGVLTADQMCAIFSEIGVPTNDFNLADQNITMYSHQTIMRTDTHNRPNTSVSHRRAQRQSDKTTTETRFSTR